MKKTKSSSIKSILAFVMSFLLVFTLMPQLSFAQGTGSANSVSVTLTGTKYLTNGNLEGKTFKFKAVSSNGQTVYGSNSGSLITFEPLTFTAVGTYTVNISEEDTTIPGVIKDNSTKTVKIKVVSENGVLKAFTAYPGGTLPSDFEIDQVNKVSASQNTYVWPAGTNLAWVKQGNPSKDGFIIWSKDILTSAQVGEIANSIISADSSIPADAKYFYYSGVGTFQPYPDSSNWGQYKFSYNSTGQLILEVLNHSGDLDGGKISHSGYGAYSPASGGTPGTLTFTNLYQPEGTSAIIEGTKTLEVNFGDRVLQDQEFEFGLYKKGALLQSTKNNGDGTFAFQPISYNAPGTYNYIIKEIIPAEEEQPYGITYDTTVFQVTVTVTDTNGKLEATVNYENNLKPAFVNTYDKEPGSTAVILEGTKKLEGRQMEAGEFSFEVLEGDQVVATGTNDEDGNITFSEIKYSASGTYIYTVVETTGNAPGVTYDENAYTVKVTVGELDSEGNFPAPSVSYPLFGLKFVNKYVAEVDPPTEPTDPTDPSVPTDPEVPLGQIKVIKKFFLNDEAKEFNGSFTVGLYKDSAFTVPAKFANGDTVLPKEINMDRNDTAFVTFENLPFGTYYVAELDKNGMPLPAGDITGSLVQEAHRQEVSYENSDVTISKDSIYGESTVVNKFWTEEEYLLGSIVITKKVTLNGNPFNSNSTYYAALFADKACTERVSDVKAFNMNGNSKATIEFTDLEIGTYFVGETDKDGNLLDAEANGIEEIQVINGEIEIGEETLTGSSTIINKYIDENHYLETEDDQAKTGDDSNLGGWLMTLMLAGIAMIYTLFGKRKQQSNK